MHICRYIFQNPKCKKKKRNLVNLNSQNINSKLKPLYNILHFLEK